MNASLLLRGVRSLGMSVFVTTGAFSPFLARSTQGARHWGQTRAFSCFALLPALFLTVPRGGCRRCLIFVCYFWWCFRGAGALRFTHTRPNLLPLDAHVFHPGTEIVSAIVRMKHTNVHDYALRHDPLLAREQLPGSRGTE